MKEREITDVQPRPGGGWLVTTWEGAQTALLPDGPPRAVPRPKLAQPAPAPAAAPADGGSSPAPPAKAAPAKGRRGRKPPTKPEPQDVYPADADVAARLAWVGEDPVRAAAALEYETGRDDEPDAELVSQLEALGGAS